jgi:NAD(P)-dependent dehydrogenase (short-subunit alcohol dehydrogenase family)
MTEAKRLADKTLLVAGAATGIGAACARRLAAEGARVVVGDIDLPGAEATAKTITEDGGQAVAVHVDIADEASVRELVAAAVDAYGGLDGAHVNAGAMHLLPGDTDVVGMDLDTWDGTMAVNLRGHMLVTRHVVPRLLERGGGSIVYTSSDAAFVGEPTRPAYAVTKAGINAIARHVASRWGRDGIRANAIAPGLVLTDRIREGADEELKRKLLRNTPSPRLGEPGDIAAMVAMLLSDGAAWVNGQVFNVDGGTVMR